jgi:hypothetical protein
MAIYTKVMTGFTIAANTTLGPYTISWQASAGPNHGPLIVTADPRSHQSAQVCLVASDLAKCRHAPPPGKPPGGAGATEVFYTFSVTNKSNIDAIFDVEVVWGQIGSTAPSTNTW